jgi:ABC-2 type transport system permease protein
MMSPLLAKLMPEILGSMEMQGIKIVLPEPTAIDAYAQFFKNFTQMGILILLLVFGGTLSNELSRGTLINILAKGMSRNNVLLSKYIAAVFLWSFGYAMAAGVTIGYTSYLFGDARVNHLFLALFCLWLFGCLVLALIILSSAVTSGSFGGLILTAIVIVLMLLLGSFPAVARFNPITLASENMKLITGAANADFLITPILVSVVLTLSSLAAAMIIFSKKRL